MRIISYSWCMLGLVAALTGCTSMDDDIAKTSDRRPLIVQDRPIIAKAVGSASLDAAKPIAWANTTSGSTGVVTTAALSQGQTGNCRDFASSYQTVSGNEQLTGIACKDQMSQWNVINLKTDAPG